MKKLSRAGAGMILMAGILVAPAWSEEKIPEPPKESPGVKTESPVVQPEKTPAAESKSNPEKALEKKEPAAAETVPAAKEEPAKPAAAPSAPATAAPAKETAAPPKEEPPAPAKKEPRWSGLVFPLKELAQFHEKQSADVEKMMERWNAKVQGEEKKKSDLAQEAGQLEKQISGLESEDPKKNKKEIARHKGRLERLKKEQKILDKEIGEMRGDLVSEIKSWGKEAQAAFKQTLEEVQRSVSGSGGE